MKKCIAILLILLAMSFCLSFAASAERSDFALSEDLMTLYWDGNTYHRMDTSNTMIYNTSVIECDPIWTSDQQEQFIDWNFRLSKEALMIEAVLYYRAGGYLTCTYVLEDFIPQLNAYQTGDGVACFVEGSWKNIYTTEAQLKGRRTTLDASTLQFAISQDVYADTKGEYYYVCTGAVMVQNSKCYYVDFSEMDRLPALFYPEDYTSLDCYEITDTDLHQALISEFGPNTSNGVTENLDDFFEVLILIYMVVIFGVIPLAILVLSLILAIKRKGYYRLIWFITAGLCNAELVIFLTVCANLFLT